MLKIKKPVIYGILSTALIGGVYFGIQYFPESTITSTSKKTFFNKEPNHLFIVKTNIKMDEIAKKSKVPPRVMEYFKAALRNDPKKRDLFYNTLSLFGNSPAGYSVARFIVLSNMLDSRPEYGALLKWTKTSMNQDPNEIIRVLHDKKNEFYEDSIAHQSMLNMISSLNISADAKIDLYMDSLKRPIKTDRNGALTHDSLNFGVALTLLHQTEKNGTVLVPKMKEAFELLDDSDSKEAFKLRVVSYYPNLKEIFE